MPDTADAEAADAFDGAERCGVEGEERMDEKADGISCISSLDALRDGVFTELLAEERRGEELPEVGEEDEAEAGFDFVRICDSATSNRRSISSDHKSRESL